MPAIEATPLRHDDDRDELARLGCRLITTGELQHGAELAHAKILARIPHHVGDGELLIVRCALWKPNRRHSGFTTRVHLFSFNSSRREPHSFSVRFTELRAAIDALDDALDLGRFGQDDEAA